MAIIHVFTQFQLIALKNLYDQDIWPDKIGFIHDTGDLYVEYDHSVVGENGIYSKKETIKIPKENDLDLFK